MTDFTPSALRRIAPAVARNRDAIAAVLDRVLPPAGTILEIASGTGEHACHFARLWPARQWQPSDPDAASRDSIAAWRLASALPNLRGPLAIDVRHPEWFDHADLPAIDPIAAIVCINMIHIAPWEATDALFGGASMRLKQHAPLFLYGPFIQSTLATAPSNVAFDEQLRSRNTRWGIRALDDVREVAAHHGFALSDVVDMPANNLSVVFSRV